MNLETSQVQAVARFTDPLIAQLKRHPKRVVFTDGEDLRVLHVAARLVEEQAIVPILLGNIEAIRALAAEHGVSLKFVKVLNPAQAADFPLFCQRYEKILRYRGAVTDSIEQVVSRPHVFGALMIQYGQADAMVGGNNSMPTALFRALIQSIKPLPEVPKFFGVTVLSAPHLAHFGEDGLVFLADTGMIPEPSTDDLAAIAIETGKLARHMLGRKPRIALLSHSTKGSAGTAPARKVAAAAAIARDRVSEEGLDFWIEGEVQADVAMDPAAAEWKLPNPVDRSSADVLVFPNLDAAHISLKLLQHCAGAVNFGPLVMGLARPVAQVPRTVSEESLYGTAAAVAVEAIKYHQLYPDGEV
ncbi:phosphotransacetylase [Haloferula luteola]|uniref:Phosphotransacetylase n=1 Tax=Haloferula luteola TaxID=595692 RepID=A0A840V0V3_9BACT|nr:phosphate acyltransferase [Haloferula luteola]MBB5351987.1 phosphotransacetylase [Haloferula luteola]